MWRAVAVGLLLLPTLSTAAATEPRIDNDEAPSDTRLFLHLGPSAFREFPITPDAPPAAWSFSGGLGLSTHTTSCAPDQGAARLLDSDFHTWYGYASPRPVTYDERGPAPLEANDEYRGFTFPVRLDPDVPIMLTWFLETQASPMGGGAPTPGPQVEVRATLLADGEDAAILAQGRSLPALLAGPLTSGASYEERDGRHIYGFVVALDPRVRALPESGFRLRVDTYLAVPGCDDPAQGSLMPNMVRLHSSPESRPTLNLGILDALRIEGIGARFHGGSLFIHAIVTSPWGPHHVPPEALHLTLSGPERPQGVEQVAVFRAPCHCPQELWAVFGWYWNHTAQQAPPGIYTATFRLELPGGSNSTASVPIDLARLQGMVCRWEPGLTNCIAEEPLAEAKATPGPTLLLLVAALLGSTRAVGATLKKGRGVGRVTCRT